MKGQDEKFLKETFQNSAPPAVSPGEWEAVWSDVAASHPRTRKPRLRLAGALAFAATFFFGVGFGLWASVQFKPSSPPPSPGASAPAAESDRSSDEVQPTLASQEDGMDLFGLKNVQIETLGPSVMGLKRYRLTAQTPRGIPVVWNYYGGQPTLTSEGGRS